MSASVHTLLEDRVALTTGLPLFQRENKRITPSVGTPWSRFTLLPAEPAQESLGITGRNQLRGFAQVDLFYPQDQGTTTANAMADTVVAQVPRGLILEDDDIRLVVEMSWRGRGEKVESYYQVPVSIRWRAHFK